MPLFTRNAFATPFGRNVYLRSTQDVKTASYMVAAETVPAVTIDGHAGQKVLQPGTVMAVITVGSNAGKVGPFQAAGTNEVQTATVTGTPTGGTFTLTFDGETTAAIAYNAAASVVQAALEGLPNIEVGDVTVSGSAGGPWTITFVGQEGGINQSQITSDAALLTGGTTPAVAMATTVPGVAGATDGRQTDTNIVGICNTFLPWQLMEGDREIAVVYEASVVQASCLEMVAGGTYQAVSNTTAAYMVAKKTMDIKFR